MSNTTVNIQQNWRCDLCHDAVYYDYSVLRNAVCIDSMLIHTIILPAMFTCISQASSEVLLLQLFLQTAGSNYNAMGSKLFVI